MCQGAVVIRQKANKSTTPRTAVSFQGKSKSWVGFKPMARCTLGERPTNGATRATQQVQIFNTIQHKGKHWERLYWVCVHMYSCRVVRCMNKDVGSWVEMFTQKWKSTVFYCTVRCTVYPNMDLLYLWTEFWENSDSQSELLCTSW